MFDGGQVWRGPWRALGRDRRRGRCPRRCRGLERRQAGRIAPVRRSRSSGDRSLTKKRFARPSDRPANEHYREVVTPARLILRHAAIETERGKVRANGFLMDMNVVFQEFVTHALREKTRSLGTQLPVRQSASAHPPRRGLPRTAQTGPLLVGRPRLHLVGDAKYKRVKYERVPNADLYQLLAYATALDLPGGLLIYAEGETENITHRVATVDLSGTIADLQAEIDRLARCARNLRDETRAARRAA